MTNLDIKERTLIFLGVVVGVFAFLLPSFITQLNWWSEEGLLPTWQRRLIIILTWIVGIGLIVGVWFWWRRAKK